jgi:hypothetical protein
MAKQKLIPASETKARDHHEPHDRFTEFAARVVAVPKSEIDKREDDWKRNKKRLKVS